MGLFIYGTLRDPVLFSLIAGPGPGQRQTASITGFRVERAADSSLPVLVACAGQTTIADYWTGLSDAQNARLDAYEVPFDYARVPVTVRLADGEQEAAEVYMPAAGTATNGQLWQIAEWDADDGQVTRLAGAEIAAHAPALTADELAAQWPMIRARAHAAARAMASDVPARTRYAPAPGDTPPPRTVGLTGSFFKFQTVDIVHRRFDGAMSPPLRREAFRGVDAALVLPYDPATDRVLLVEQFRTGPFMRGDANPWTLEPVAGIVDSGESPETAALREAHEEAGLAEMRLRPMFDYYPSPGASTDYFYCYLGLADLTGPARFNGGLESEHEDLRLHVLSRDDALALIDSGEITAGPLITMLYWLDRNRGRLSALA